MAEQTGQTNWFKSLCEQAEQLGERLNLEQGDSAALSSILNTIGGAEEEAERDSLRSQIEAEVEGLRVEAGDPQLNEFAQQQAEVDADRLQAILDSTSTEGEGRC